MAFFVAYWLRNRFARNCDEMYNRHLFIYGGLKMCDARARHCFVHKTSNLYDDVLVVVACLFTLDPSVETKCLDI